MPFSAKIRKVTSVCRLLNLPKVCLRLNAYYRVYIKILHFRPNLAAKRKVSTLEDKCSIPIDQRNWSVKLTFTCISTDHTQKSYPLFHYLSIIVYTCPCYKRWKSISTPPVYRGITVVNLFLWCKPSSISWTVGFSPLPLSMIITKTRLYKYIENFTSKNWKFSDKISDVF